LGNRQASLPSALAGTQNPVPGLKQIASLSDGGRCTGLSSLDGNWLFPVSARRIQETFHDTRRQRRPERLFRVSLSVLPSVHYDGMENWARKEAGSQCQDRRKPGNRHLPDSMRAKFASYNIVDTVGLPSGNVH